MNIIERELKIIGIKDETHDVKTFQLDLQGTPFDYKAGQFATLIVKSDGKILSRSFTISSSPTNIRHLGITIKKYPDSRTAAALHALKVGDTLKIRAPFGNFHYTEDLKKICFIAGGNGITPGMSMLRFITDKKLDASYTILYSSQTERDIIFKTEFDELESKFDNIKIVHTITDDDKWNGHKGRIDAEFIKQNVEDLQETIFFICGPPPFIPAMIEALKQIGVKIQNIRTEAFVRPGVKI